MESIHRHLPSSTFARDSGQFIIKEESPTVIQELPLHALCEQERYDLISYKLIDPASSIDETS